jgi:hypothetical protein
MMRLPFLLLFVAGLVVAPSITTLHSALCTLHCALTHSSLAWLGFALLGFALLGFAHIITCIIFHMSHVYTLSSLDTLLHHLIFTWLNLSKS